MDITWTVEVTPLVGALILIALILTVVSLVDYLVKNKGILLEGDI